MCTWVCLRGPDLSRGYVTVHGLHGETLSRVIGQEVKWRAHKGRRTTKVLNVLLCDKLKGSVNLSNGQNLWFGVFGLMLNYISDRIGLKEGHGEAS